jgi:hypothetical protein
VLRACVSARRVEMQGPVVRSTQRHGAMRGCSGSFASCRNVLERTTVASTVVSTALPCSILPSGLDTYTNLATSQFFRRCFYLCLLGDVSGIVAILPVGGHGRSHCGWLCLSRTSFLAVNCNALVTSSLPSWT